MTGERGADGLLARVRVLDLSIWRPGPFATQLLVELGADVVKVEPPGGDPMRVFPELFATLNRGKRAATVDLKDGDGRSAVLELARDADVVVEGFRPGVSRRLGVDEPAIRARNPAVVYCSISGYGQEGALAGLPGHDLNYQAWAGILDPQVEGSAPVVARPPLADLSGGAYAAFAICAALAKRTESGGGETIDVAMADVLASWTGAVPPLTLPDGRAVGGEVAGYGTFRTADGRWVALGVVSEDRLWADLVTALGLADLTTATFAERVEHSAALTARLGSAIERRDRDELVHELIAAGVPVAPVLSQEEMLEAEQFRSRGVVARDPNGTTFMRHPLRYRRHPVATPRDTPDLLQVAHGRLPSWRSDR